LVFKKEHPDVRFYECIYGLIRKLRPADDFKMMIDNYTRALKSEREY